MELIIRVIITLRYLRIKNIIIEATLHNTTKWQTLNLSHQVQAKEATIYRKVTLIHK